MAERKAAPHYIKAISGRTVTGIFSVFGNIDAYDDIVMPGAFAKTISERAGRILHFWAHDISDVPTAVVNSLREIGRDELPPEVLAAAPDALGGCEVTRTYLDTDDGNEVLTALTSGVPLQMSFGFDPVTYDFAEVPTMPGYRVRRLTEVRLYETSDVNFGANDATVASRASPAELIKQLNGLLNQMQAVDIKSGARHSEADYKLLDDAAAIMVRLGARNITLTQSDDSKSAPPPDPPAPQEIILPSPDDLKAWDEVRFRFYTLSARF